MIQVGTLIGERYEVIGHIGNGGMANVYLAKDLILNREVAIKVLRFDFQNDKDAIRRFQREALAATEMVHPNIVSVYDVGEERNMQYIVMEYVKGMDLKQYIKEHYPIPLPVVVDMMEQILSAISLAHQHRIIHRDIKPQNVLVDEDGTVKITDFGIAIALSETSITQTNTLLGSVHYMSPEQARGGMATRQSDIYALGIILYELLIGVVPFGGESAVSIALKHFQNDVPSVREVNPEIPQALENVVLHATAKEVADRYTSVDEMYADLRTVLSPDRAYEAKFEPSAMTNDTIMMTPLDDTQTSLNKTASRVVSTADFDNEDDEEEDIPQKKSKKWLGIVMGLMIAAILVGGGLFALGSRGGEVVIPDIEGLTESEAIALLDEKKLSVSSKVEEVSDDEVEKGLVVKTNPPIGTKVKEKAEITLYVSTGSQKIKMKDYTNEELTDAMDDLLSKGFKEANIDIQKEYSDTVGNNRVIKQTPKGNRAVAPDETGVTLFVSKGAESFSLENMYGYSKNRATSYLDSVGLSMLESGEYSDVIPQGQVIYTVPNSGSSVSKGDTITVVFSSGVDPATIESSTVESTESSSTTTTDSKELESVEQSSSEPTTNSAEDKKS